MANKFILNTERDAIAQLIQDKMAARGVQPRRIPAQPYQWPETPPTTDPVSLTQLMRDLLSANEGELAKVFVNAWYRQACLGGRTAMRELLSRIEGVGEHAE